MPPWSCTAFGNARLAVYDPSVCVTCNDSVVGPVALITTFTVATVVACALFVRLVARRPSAIKRRISTITVIINHAQTISILGSLLRMACNSGGHLCLRLNVFDFPQASCILDDGDTS